MGSEVSVRVSELEFRGDEIEGRGEREVGRVEWVCLEAVVVARTSTITDTASSTTDISHLVEVILEVTVDWMASDESGVDVSTDGSCSEVSL